MSDVSLRELAAALGTSHRMLLYHFGSRRALLVAVAREVERRQREVLAGMLAGSGGDLEDLARRFWHRLRSPELAPLERLFFELYGRALQGSPDAVPFLVDVVDAWVEPAAAALVASGVPPEEARAEARLGLAVVRGLLLDVLATGDGPAVDAAFERHLASQRARLARGG